MMALPPSHAPLWRRFDCMWETLEDDGCMLSKLVVVAMVNMDLVAHPYIAIDWGYQPSRPNTPGCGSSTWTMAHVELVGYHVVTQDWGIIQHLDHGCWSW